MRLKLSLGNDKNDFCPSAAICSVGTYVYCMLCLLFLQDSCSLTRLFNQKLVDVFVFKRKGIKPLLIRYKKLTCRLQHMVEKSLKMSFQWHTRTPLTWDFDHELSRCTYPGNLQ